MIVHLILSLVVTAFLFYVFCYSPPAKRIGDEVLYDPLLASSMAYPYILEDDE